MKQLSFFKKQKSAYGGELLKSREGRMRPRPLSTRETMHLVLRSSKAKGEWSFRRPRHNHQIRRIVRYFSDRYGVKVLSLANVGNHLHFQIKLSNRYTYAPFIRAITGAIAMSVTGQTRWNLAMQNRAQERSNFGQTKPLRFWDYRPFTRVVESLKALLNLRDYIKVNQLEGFGYQRTEARWMIAQDRSLGWATKLALGFS